ncbi:hypothetical protein SAMN05445060_0995 [Williamsia sterculiae]|uniref:Uncharacterized protein n=1 Tax=Williamsia sterculiae TaxID=1344003 RepID=A0A1N7DXC9_9NOCA|nr:hypothetical protein SAMN05445060_0995 [Williamsia sterculiae]
MRLRRRNDIFRDRRVDALSRSQTDRAIRCARRAALDAQETVTLTARRQYRRYRRRAGDEFMEWPQWHHHYSDAYHWKALNIGDKDPWGGMPRGSYGGIW